MWIYKRETGELFHDTALIGVGYSGYPPHTNITADDGLHNLGPLPAGFYIIDNAYTHPHLGPICMNLEPDPTNQMKGRSLFRLHADSIEHPGFASDGCIVMNHTIREQVAASSDKKLQVL